MFPDPLLSYSCLARCGWRPLQGPRRTTRYISVCFSRSHFTQTGRRHFGNAAEKFHQIRLFRQKIKMPPLTKPKKELLAAIRNTEDPDALKKVLDKRTEELNFALEKVVVNEENLPWGRRVSARFFLLFALLLFAPSPSIFSPPCARLLPNLGS